tara:strand:+ start:5589 stop:6269 length:681 start_codon:yes stop_codon:yes gene_type:complete
MVSFHDIAKGSDHLIKFLHVATGTRVEFPAFVTEFSDSFSVTWGSEQIFGRTDPIKPYRGTTRRISVAFDVLAPTLEKAKENMNNYSTLVKMMYPVYGEPLSGGEKGLGRTIKAPPLLRVQFLNLVKNYSDESMEEGLLGCIGGFNFRPNKESGFFTLENELLPKNFSISFTFEPQHESPLGFRGKNFINPAFPYGRPSEDPVDADKVGSGTAQVQIKRENDILGD